MTHSLYTTLRPDRLLEVDDAERADLEAQGLILAEIDPATGEVIRGALDVPAALDAAETVTDDQPATRPKRSGG
jgi:hypothetical protein